MTLILGSNRLYAQQVSEINLGNTQRISWQSPVTALAIQTEKDLGKSILLMINDQEVVVPFDPDAPLFTYFLSLDQPLINPSIQWSASEGSLFLINSGNAPASETPSHRYDQQDCPLDFTSISQSEWRSGLPAPNYSRIFTEVSHVVIHHSAGSNTNTNYTQVVRDIYLYHTQVNGWSDIGYNYLISQDGTIYTGRDPAGGEQDNVLGAHFCGANSTTMGICLLGNYEEVQPNGNAINSLERIIAFKLNKENLNPYLSYPHEFGMLGSIIGHRDGCSTLCPGENVYSLLGQIRTDTEQVLKDCSLEPIPEYHLGFTSNALDIYVGQEVQFENQSFGYDAYQWVYEGGSPRFSTYHLGSLIRYDLPGLFDVTLIGLRGETSDTLTKNNLIEVLGPPIIYPNPLTNQNSLKIASADDVQSIYLITGKGQLTVLRQEADRIILPAIEPGVYLLRIQTSDRIVMRKLLVY